MPKYYNFKVADCYLYFTSHCVVEAMHVHASEDSRLKEGGSAKFWVNENGDSKLANLNHALSKQQIKEIQKFIKKHYKDMYDTWSKSSPNGFYKNI